MIQNPLETNQFSQQIDNYLKMESWQKEGLTLEHIKQLFEANSKNLVSPDEDANLCERLSAFIGRIEEEFPDDIRGKELASRIRNSINPVFPEYGPMATKNSPYLPSSATPPKQRSSTALPQDAGNITFQQERIKKEKRRQPEELFNIQRIQGPTSPIEAIEHIIANNLSKINLREFKDFNSGHVKTLSANCPNITSLILHASPLEWPEMKSLQSVFLRQCNDASAASLAHNCPNLQEISLGRTRITDQGLQSLARERPNLRTLVLGRTQITDRGVKSVADNCRNLRSISLGKTYVTDDGISYLAGKCPDLEAIYLWETQVTDKGVMSLADKCPNLEVIYLWKTAITDEGIKSLASQCPQLRAVTIGGTQVSDDGVEFLVSHCPNLEIISLQDTQVTDRAVKSLREHCTNLEIISLRDTQVSKEAVESLRDQFPRLRFVL